MMRNQKLLRAIGDAGWSAFNNMSKYRNARVGRRCIEVNRFFVSRKIGSCCLNAQAEMPLNIRMRTCDKSCTKHDRDFNASINIRNEAERMIIAEIVVTASEGTLSYGAGRKSSIANVLLKFEALLLSAG